MLNKLIAGILIELTPLIPPAVEQISKSISETYDELFEDDIDYNLIKEQPDDEVQLNGNKSK